MHGVVVQDGAVCMHEFAFDDPGDGSAGPDAAAASSAYFAEGASGVGGCVHVCVCVVCG